MFGLSILNYLWLKSFHWLHWFHHFEVYQPDLIETSWSIKLIYRRPHRWFWFDQNILKIKIGTTLPSCFRMFQVESISINGDFMENFHPKNMWNDSPTRIVQNEGWNRYDESLPPNMLNTPKFETVFFLLGISTWLGHWDHVSYEYWARSDRPATESQRLCSW